MTKPLKPIYLCGPIFGRSNADAIDWREEVKASSPWPTLDPMRRDYRGREVQLYREIVEGDLRDIGECWALLVYFDKPSVGTSMEIFNAYWIGKKVVVINASGDVRISPWLIFHSHAIVSSVADGLDLLDRLARETEGIDQLAPEQPPAAGLPIALVKSSAGESAN